MMCKYAPYLTIKYNLFSPEKHGVVRFGSNLAARPTMPKELYETLISSEVNKNENKSSSCPLDLASIIGVKV